MAPVSSPGPSSTTSSANPCNPTTWKAPHRKRFAKSEIAGLIEKGIPEVFKWEDDEISLRAAAVQSRLPFDKMTSQEMAAFEDCALSNPSIMLYLYIRNKICQMWLLEPNVELTLEQVHQELVPPFNSDVNLVKRVHAFLTRFGYVNYGVYHRLTPSVPHTRKRVIVVGAGVSGMIATRQLKQFGFDVVVLEARCRVGGRVHTYKGKRTGSHADLGAMVITGICGNPLMVLGRQLPMGFETLHEDCPVYDQKGKPIDKKKDKIIEDSFNMIGDVASFLVHERGVEEVEGKKVDLETAYDNIMCMMELRMQKSRKDHFEKFEETLGKLKEILNEMMIYKKSAELIAEKLNELDNKAVSNFTSKIEREIVRKCYKKDLAMAVKGFDDLDIRRRNVEMTLSSMRKKEPKSCTDIFMNSTDRRILDFHFANLEYANGTMLRNLSLKYWDQDDDHEFSGSHLLVNEGLSQVFSRLVLPSEVLMKMVVEEIKYDENGVTVCAMNLATAEIEQFKGDAVLITCPLGVLKRSIRNTTDAPRFSPPLPDDKVMAIERVGFGNLNKIVLMFEKPFWDKEIRHFFGNLQQDKPGSAGRGELYMFTAPPNQSVLIGLLAGDSAYIDLPREVMITRAMRVLSLIFGPIVPPPKEAIMTTWHKDIFSSGCYSYMATESEAEDYDRLAAAVKGMDKEGNRVGKERLFFAGEHTNRNFPATVHGAFLSGIREAGRIADVFSGCPYLPPEKDVVDIEDDEVIDLEEGSPAYTVSSQVGKDQTLQDQEKLMGAPPGSKRGRDSDEEKEEKLRSSRDSNNRADYHHSKQEMDAVARAEAQRRREVYLHSIHNEVIPEYPEDRNRGGHSSPAVVHSSSSSRPHPHLPDDDIIIDE